ncbi:OmpA family protein [Cellulomonas cellasea]|uniref:Outer membrane protein OmpA-like peptidoglycan-associated protein n=1 Tax=Cellulomonas cellasea TaxID=43670 RepID=A0A7W4UJC7_9CELL|nr:OmpA family protein [Cellulomonas cellasea]MBB2925251.1 outer membrane protein OmpA-like peptidoglycan-associated protein [Cellulomonas cellasea]
MARRVGVLVLAGALLPAALPATAASERGDGVPSGVVVVDGQDVPVLGSFTFRAGWDPRSPEVVGFVHGVRRVEGGTAVYYSLGPAPDADEDLLAESVFESASPYDPAYATEIGLVDVASTTMYSPLRDADSSFASGIRDLSTDQGTLVVGWAVFPALPPTTTTVQVRMPSGTIVPGVPVEDGALEPVSDEPAPLLGAGWPEVPEGAELAAADPAAATWTLLRRSGDLQAIAQAQESPRDVAVTLDTNVLFATGATDPGSPAQTVLAGLAADIAARGTGEVLVTGHTDADGTDEFNQTLSENRALAVRESLEPASGGGVTFTSSGRGESEPVASNDTDEGKQANRRVTVVYTLKGGGQ